MPPTDSSGASALVSAFADLAQAAGDDPPPAKPSRRNDRLYPFTHPLHTTGSHPAELFLPEHRQR
jgi:hypothetical protein